MSTPEFKLDTNAPTVNWAEPKNSGESASTPQVILSFEHHITKCYLLCFLLFMFMDVHFFLS